jgi:hypothetical protein
MGLNQAPICGDDGKLQDEVDLEIIYVESGNSTGAR